MKNKKTIYIVIAIIVVLLVLAVFMLVGNNDEKVYKVGKHIEAGEYVLVGKGEYTILDEVIEKDYGYYEVCTTKSCNADNNELVYNNNIFGKAYVILEEGQYLRLREDMELYKIDEYEINVVDEISYDYSLGFDSYYKIGKDLSAGTYTFTGDEFYYEVCIKPSCVSFDVLENEVITNEFIDKEDERNTATVTLEEGQYLIINGTEPFTVTKEN